MALTGTNRKQDDDTVVVSSQMNATTMTTAPPRQQPQPSLQCNTNTNSNNNNNNNSNDTVRRRRRRQLEEERDIQRQRMEELGRQKLEIDTAMTKLARTLEQLDQDIEQMEVNEVVQRPPVIKMEAVVKLETKPQQQQQKQQPSAVAVSSSSLMIPIKSELPPPRNKVTTTSEGSSSSTDEKKGHHTLTATQHQPLRSSVVNDSSSNHNINNENPSSSSCRTTKNPYSPPQNHERRTDPNLPSSSSSSPPPCSDYRTTEPNYDDIADDDDFQLYDDDDDDDDDVDDIPYDRDEQDENGFVNAYVQQQHHHQQPPPARTTTSFPGNAASVSTTNVDSQPSRLITHTIMPTRPPEHLPPPNSRNSHRHTNHHVITPPSDHHPTTTATYPWSTTIHSLLQNTFRIPSFREQQLDIINTTMRGLDTFVIMRTGGGKSLTYQLPALYEGRYLLRNNTKNTTAAKITLVISPLLSLIQDQEEQMNLFAPGSAISFTSSIGTAEHTKRWNQVQDPNGGICIIFCTPEKVSKSNRLCAELDKLQAQHRLGRFVIDEAHCACQWGHDFRPDYAKLGKLKSHFPNIPVIAVTATASDRVRDDVCEILRIRHDYQFFRSTFHRPNLMYSVIPKPDQKESTIEIMANFIKSKYPNDAGIVYTYSKKDADNVADALCTLGVIAEPYHSDVNASTKEAVHKSWMRNETQVVVATIAFGLGINKPDVRFVLHHSISKTLEAYYQESGRAGRDGNPSECVLYYNPKDVFRMLKMVHGTSSEHLIWPMVRYAQQSGNDTICKAILLTHLGEPNAPDVMKIVSENEEIVTQKRDVGKHAKTVVELLHIRELRGENVTMAMLVKDWRSTGAGAEQCVKDNPPKKDGLTQDDCERIITSLLLEKVISTNPKWNAYDTVIYLVLGELGPNMLSSTNPKFVMRLPIQENTKAVSSQSSKAATTKAAKQSTLRKTLTKDGDWLSTKSVSVKRKKAVKAQSKPAKKVKGKSTKKPAPKAAVKAAPTKGPVRTKKGVSNEVIELSSDDDETEEDIPLMTLRQVDEHDANEVLWNDDDENGSDVEYEFED